MCHFSRILYIIIIVIETYWSVRIFEIKLLFCSHGKVFQYVGIKVQKIVVMIIRNEEAS